MNNSICHIGRLFPAALWIGVTLYQRRLAEIAGPSAHSDFTPLKRRYHEEGKP